MKKFIIGLLVAMPFYFIGNAISDSFVSGWLAGSIALLVQNLLTDKDK